MVSAISYWSKIQVEDLDSFLFYFLIFFSLQVSNPFHTPRCVIERTLWKQPLVHNLLGMCVWLSLPGANPPAFDTCLGKA